MVTADISIFRGFQYAHKPPTQQRFDSHYLKLVFEGIDWFLTQLQQKDRWQNRLLSS